VRPGPAGPAVGSKGSHLLALAVILFSSLARADITGTVTLKGKPNSQDQTFFAKANGCGESPIRHTENWKVGAKGELADVVVWIIDPKLKDGVADAKASEVEVKQVGCRYVPHVIAVQAGENFKVINGDPTLHNIRAKKYDGSGASSSTDLFNFGQATQGQSDEKEFDDPGIYTLQCDVHGWMQCWVMVVKGPCFAVTGGEGTYKLRSTANLADGDYKIHAWHPRFADPLEQTIHVQNGTAHADFVFDGTKSF